MFSHLDATLDSLKYGEAYNSTSSLVPLARSFKCYYIKNQTLTLDEEIFPSMWHILLLVLLKDLVEMIWRNLKCQVCLLHFLLHLDKENNLCFGIELWPYQWFPFLVHHLPKIRRSLWFFHKDWTKKNWTIFQTLNFKNKNFNTDCKTGCNTGCKTGGKTVCKTGC